MQTIPHDTVSLLSRRAFLSRTATGSLGALALASLLAEDTASGAVAATRVPHVAPRAKRVIFLCQSGGPSQFETFDYKPKLMALMGQPMPESLTKSQRLAQIQGQKLIVCGSPYKFARHGQSGAEVSELLPYTAGIADEICIIRSAVTEAINHDPAVTFLQCGSQQVGRPTMGAWLSYGLGSANRDLPAFIVLCSNMDVDQNLHTRYWGAGFLPSEHQGVMFRSTNDPVLYVSNPPGINPAARRRILDGIRQINELRQVAAGDPEIATRIEAYEMAYRMQTSVPDLMDISDEPQHVLTMYGPDVHKPGTYARNCLLARRLAERDVRFIQLYHRGWDSHSNLPKDHTRNCLQSDQPSAALVMDLKRRGLLDDTLVIWAGEFGRTPMLQGKLDIKTYGRDHHMLCFSIWLAGGGIKGGQTIGQSDDFGYQVAADPVHIHNLHATLLHCLGIDHERLTFRFQGRDFRLTDVAGQVLPALLA